MHSKPRFQNLIFGPSSSPASTALAIMLTLLFLILLLVLMNLTALPAQAQTFKVIYNFTGGGDGAQPEGVLTMDAAGNLYGTTSSGGHSSGCPLGSCGAVFKLSHKGSNWILNPLYDFSGSDGGNPLGGVVFGPDGTLYGTTLNGGVGGGVVYNLRVPPRACTTVLCPWTETVLYSFQGWPAGDGSGPGDNLTFDQKGNLYGTTSGGGNSCGYESWCGTVFELTPSGSGWTESILYAFTGSNHGDGDGPDSSLIFDQSGNFYGTTGGGGTGYCGGGGCGTVYELTPSGNGWTEKVLYSFQNGNDGAGPTGVIFDNSGNLYGVTSGGSQNGSGAFFKLTPSNGQWTFTVLFSGFPGNGGGTAGPIGGLVMDAAGNFYGVTNAGGKDGGGSVFKLTPSGGGWTYTSLHDFTGGSDGVYPLAGVTLDAHGNIYGTAGGAGAYGNGAVWEITP